MATVFKVDDAEGEVSQLLNLLSRGEDVVIERDSRPVARLTAYQGTPAQPPRRVPGTLKGQISLPDSFFDPMTDEELKDWGY